MPPEIMAWLHQAASIGLAPSMGLAAFVIPSFFVMGLTGFGPAIVFHVAWQLLVKTFPSLTAGSQMAGENDLVDAVMLLAVNAPFSIIPLYYESKKDISWDYFWWLFIPKTTCFCLGTEVLVRTPPAVLKVVLGIVFLVFAVWLIGKEFNQLGLSAYIRNHGGRPWMWLASLMDTIFPVSKAGGGIDGHPWRWKTAAALCGGASGFLNGMFGTPGPPLMIFFALAPGCNPSVIRATSTACHFWNLPIRMFYFFGVKRRFDPTKIVHMLIVISFGQVGLRLGNRMHDTAKERFPHTLKWCMHALLIVGSALMVGLSLPAQVGLLVASSAFVVFMHRHEPEIRRVLIDHDPVANASVSKI